jgi:hypothetical protein
MFAILGLIIVIGSTAIRVDERHMATTVTAAQSSAASPGQSLT